MTAPMEHFGTEFTSAMRAAVEQGQTDLRQTILPEFAERLTECGGDYAWATARFAPALLAQDDWGRGAYASALAIAVAEVHRLKEQQGSESG